MNKPKNGFLIQFRLTLAGNIPFPFFFYLFESSSCWWCSHHFYGSIQFCSGCDSLVSNCLIPKVWSLLTIMNFFCVFVSPTQLPLIFHLCQIHIARFYDLIVVLLTKLHPNCLFGHGDSPPFPVLLMVVLFSLSRGMIGKLIFGLVSSTHTKTVQHAKALLCRVHLFSYSHLQWDWIYSISNINWTGGEPLSPSSLTTKTERRMNQPTRTWTDRDHQKTRPQTYDLHKQLIMSLFWTRTTTTTTAT